MSQFFHDIVSHKDVKTPNQHRTNSPQFSLLFDEKSRYALRTLISDTRIFRSVGIECNVLMLLQGIHGFRIGELLSLTVADVTPQGFIKVKGSKKSHSRIVYFPDILHMPFFIGRKPTDRIFSLSYRQYYLILKRHGIEKKIHTYSKNRAVTHIFRHTRLKENDRIAPDEFQVQKNFSGHKSTRGLLAYLNKRPEVNNN